MGRYILSLFDDNTDVTVRQLNLIASGKRTPSVLYNVEKNNLYVLFALFPDISLKEWQHVIQYLISDGLLELHDDYVKITPEGSIQKDKFLKKHTFINNLDQLHYSATKKLYWRRFIFITQILSEFSYQNKRYIPYLTSVDDQMSTKKWLSTLNEPLSELALSWMRELTALLQLFTIEHANFIAGHFIGHGLSGKTSRQLQSVYDLSSEHYVVLIDQLSYQMAQLDKDIFPLMTSLWDHTHSDCDEGLSRSAWLSKMLLEKGYSLEEVARRRKLKSNTIKEHILECVLITDWSYYKRYISSKHYKSLHSLFTSKPSTDFSEAKERISDLDFFTFRLVEIERVRQHE